MPTRLARLTTAAALWILPPAVLPLPSRTGPEGAPRPYGATPRFGAEPARTPVAAVRAQNRTMLDGPFPAGGLLLGVSDGTLFKSADAGRREASFALARSAGASVARITVDWRNVAPASPQAGFDARDPAEPSYDFGALDAAVRGASAAGLAPMLVVFHAPSFAEAPNRWPYAYLGSWSPNPAALEAFAAALAGRYDGSYPDPQRPGQALPRVRLWQAWNEPNLARYLGPQWVSIDGRWSAFSPLLYRQLLNAFYAGIKSVAPGDVVAAAGLAPNGDREGVGRMAPVTFLRSMLCLSPSGRGVPRRSSSCLGGQAHLDALAFHPLSVGDPDRAATSALDVAVADASKVAALARAAVSLRTVLPAATKPLWVTELNWESAPQTSQGVPPALQARWLSRALHRLWSSGVSLVAWQFLIDPYPALTLAAPDGSLISYPRPAGLYAPGPADDPLLAQPKPFVTAFRVPFDPLRVDGAHVRVWALASRAGERAELLVARGGKPWRALTTLRSGKDGVIDRLLALRGSTKLRLRVGTLLSAEAPVSARRSLQIR